MIIGFDLDGIFIDKPTIIPRRLLEWLYRGPQRNGPSYRFPKTKTEQLVRKLSHIYLFRPKIKQNLHFIHDFPSSSNPHTLYLVTSRYQFLEKTTLKILQRYKLLDCFSQIYINTGNDQPHLYKERLLKKLKIDLFIDDDIRLLTHLKKSCPQARLLWYNPKSKINAHQGIDVITDLRQVTEYLK